MLRNLTEGHSRNSAKLISACVMICIAGGSLFFAAYLTAKRHHGYDVEFFSYNDLYALSDQSRISSISKGPSGVNIGLFAHNSGSTTEFAAEIPLQYHPLRLPQAGTIEAVQQTLNLQFDTEVGALMANNATLPMQDQPKFAAAAFSPEASDYPPDHVRRAHELLSHLALDSETATLQKVERIATWLHGQLYPARGNPNSFMRQLNGFEQYNAALKEQSPVYCANHAEIFAFFATVAGTRTRIVDVGGKFGDASIAAHAFNEVYLPEIGKWAYVDLQLHVAFVTGSDGLPIDGAELLLHNKLGTLNSMQPAALSVPNGSQISPLTVKQLVRQFIPPEATLKYLWAETNRFSWPKRFERLLIAPQPAFSLHSNRYGASIRLALTYLGMLLLAAAALLVKSHRKERKRSNPGVHPS